MALQLRKTPNLDIVTADHLRTPYFSLIIYHSSLGLDAIRIGVDEAGITRIVTSRFRRVSTMPEANVEAGSCVILGDFEYGIKLDNRFVPTQRPIPRNAKMPIQIVPIRRPMEG
jgi:hypothetical protein